MALLNVPSSSACAHSNVTSNWNGLVNAVGLSSTVMLVNVTYAMLLFVCLSVCVAASANEGGELLLVHSLSRALLVSFSCAAKQLARSLFDLLDGQLFFGSVATLATLSPFE